jgi:hypothetical protein
MFLGSKTYGKEEADLQKERQQREMAKNSWKRHK